MVRKILEIHGDKDTNGSICGSIGGSSLRALFLVMGRWATIGLNNDSGAKALNTFLLHRSLEK